MNKKPSTAKADDDALRVPDLKVLNKQTEFKLKDISSSQEAVWDTERIKTHAQSLLNIPEEEVNIPAQVYVGASGETKEQVKVEYLKRRKLLLEALSKGLKPFISTDADGTVTFKTVMKVEDSRSIGSLEDKHFLRLLVKAFSKLGLKIEVNTARTGAIAGSSIMATEGMPTKAKDGSMVNPRAMSEISAITHEFGLHNLDNQENKAIFDALGINGLSGSVIHKPGQPLQIKDSALRYGKFMDKLNSISLPDAEGGFLEKLESLVGGRDEAKPLRVLEHKAIPRIFIDDTNFTLENYIRYMDLAKKAAANPEEGKEAMPTSQFLEELEELNIPFTGKYADLIANADVNDPDLEEKLTSVIRDGMIACLTPHCLQPHNVVSNENKLAFYRNFAKFTRSEEAQEWAQQEYGIPKGTDLFTINGLDVSDIDFDAESLQTFDGQHQFKNLEELVNFIGDRDKKPEHPEHILAKVVENLQPYCEIAPNSSKDDVLPSHEEVANNKLFTIGGGDSPGSDAVLLAQSLVLGGAAFKVRGLMDVDKVCSEMVKVLGDAKNANHEFAMTKVEDTADGTPQYRMNATAEVKSLNEWRDFLKEKYQDKIIHSNNIHENNAANAAIFSEFFEGQEEGFGLELNENEAWVQDVLEYKSKRDITTPEVGTAPKVNGEAEKNGEFETPLLQKMPWLAKIPFVGKHLSIEASGPLFNKMFTVTSSALMGAGAIGSLGALTGNDLITSWSKRVDKWAYALNNISSGIGRGMLTGIRYPWQFIGEAMGFASTIVPNQTLANTLRAMANTVLIGRGNELLMRENANLDKFSDAQAAKEEFGERAWEKFGNIRKSAEHHTELRDQRVKNSPFRKIPVVGPVLAEGVADLRQGLGLTWETITTKALRSNILRNAIPFMKPKGIAKKSTNSGREYVNVHSPGHAYATVGIATGAVAMASTLLGKLTGSKTVDTVLTNFANMIPSIGMSIAAHHTKQDAYGAPRKFTTVNKTQENYNPEKAGDWQKAGSWMQLVFAPFMHTTLGQFLFNAGTGAYLKGIQEDMKPTLDDASANRMHRQNRYYKESHRDTNRRSEIKSFIEQFHGRAKQLDNVIEFPSTKEALHAKAA